MTTPVWKILVLMSMLGMTMRYQETRKLNQTTYVTDYLLRNGYLTTVRVSSGHMDIVDPNGIRVAYATSKNRLRYLREPKQRSRYA